MKVLITGATGLIGEAIVKQCHKQGISVHYLTTSKSKLNQDELFKGFYWNPSKGEMDSSCFEGVDAIINLAGSSISERWTKRQKANILQSRLLSLSLLKQSYMSKKDTKKHKDDPQVNDQDTKTAQAEELSVEDHLKEELAKEKDKFIRFFADFENYKRRTAKERIELFKTASEDVMKALLPVLDDFDRAWLEISKTQEKDLLKGVELISNKLRDTLKNKGLEPIVVKQGDTFNADDHEAITQIPAPSDDLKGKIIDVVEKGYKLGDKVIRFPKVVIGQ